MVTLVAVKAPNPNYQPKPVWHPDLGIQQPLTAVQDGCDVAVLAPGNVTPFKVAQIEAGCPKQAATYAALMTAGGPMFDALTLVSADAGQIDPDHPITISYETAMAVRDALALVPRAE